MGAGSTVTTAAFSGVDIHFLYTCLTPAPTIKPTTIKVGKKDKEIYNLKGELSAKDKIIGKLREEKESIKAQLHRFKEFWHSIMGHFHKRICYDKDNNYKIVSDDLYKNGIFDNNDNEIANNILRKVTIPDENKAEKNKKKNYEKMRLEDTRNMLVLYSSRCWGADREDLYHRYGIVQ